MLGAVVVPYRIRFKNPYPNPKPVCQLKGKNEMFGRAARRLYRNIYKTDPESYMLPRQLYHNVSFKNRIRESDLLNSQFAAAVVPHLKESHLKSRPRFNKCLAWVSGDIKRQMHVIVRLAVCYPAPLAFFPRQSLNKSQI
jgi:hypothetical protein